MCFTARLCRSEVGVGVSLAALAVGAVSVEAATIVHQYDFEKSSDYTTATDWIHIDTGVAYNAGLERAGFVGTAFAWGAVDSGASTESPADVRRDYILGYGMGSTTPALTFRDIIPANATEVTYTIYRDSPGDTYYGAAVGVSLSVNSATDQQLTDWWPGGFRQYVAPYTGTLSLSQSAQTGTLDLKFFDESGRSDIRIAGIELSYTVVPEPATMTAVSVLGGVGLLRRRHRRLAK